MSCVLCHLSPARDEQLPDTGISAHALVNVDGEEGAGAVEDGVQVRH